MPDFIGDAIDAVGDAVGDAVDSPVFQAAAAPFNLVGDALDEIPVVGPYIAPAALTIAGQPELAAAYQGLHTGTKTGNPLSGLLAAGGTYAGNAIGSSLGASLGNSVGGALSQTPANALGSTFGGDAVGSLAPLGSFAGNALGSQTTGSFLGGALGSNIGGEMGSQLGGGAPLPSTDPTPFQASRDPSMGLPQSLSQFSGLDSNQQASNIASKGVYGQGNGPDENQYFLNLLNRQLVDDSGNVGSASNINPVENSYLSQLGLGGYSDPNDLLKKISQYGHA